MHWLVLMRQSDVLMGFISMSLYFALGGYWAWRRWPHFWGKS